jgi:hypothetical protein
MANHSAMKSSRSNSGSLRNLQLAKCDTADSMVQRDSSD